MRENRPVSLYIHDDKISPPSLMAHGMSMPGTFARWQARKKRARNKRCRLFDVLFRRWLDGRRCGLSLAGADDAKWHGWHDEIVTMVAGLACGCLTLRMSRRWARTPADMSHSARRHADMLTRGWRRQDIWPKAGGGRSLRSPLLTPESASLTPLPQPANDIGFATNNATCADAFLFGAKTDDSLISRPARALSPSADAAR